MDGTVTHRDNAAEHRSSTDQSERDSGLLCLVALATQLELVADPRNLSKELALDTCATINDLHRAAKITGLKSRSLTLRNEGRIAQLPLPAIACFNDGDFGLLSEMIDSDSYLIIDLVTGNQLVYPAKELLRQTGGTFILVQRCLDVPKAAAEHFGFRWFLPVLFCYRKAFGHVLLASLFVQIFALVSPLFFQVVVDKVLAHRSYSTLIVLVIGLAAIGFFDVVLQYWGHLREGAK